VRTCRLGSVARIKRAAYAGYMNGHSDSSAHGAGPSRQGEAESECSAVVLDPDAVDRVRGQLSTDARVGRTAAIFSALSDPTRVRILDALGIEELCVCDLSEVCGISQSGVSHQLRLLRDLGLVAYRRDGNRAVYRLADDHVLTLLAQGFEHADEAMESR
jgi:ArsR family transcriptional regulator, lead/cadmium/zinc/bismuth-responsive transcriptional repressor